MTSTVHQTCHHTTYHLTCRDYELLLKRSGGCCEVCGLAREQATRQRLEIDHDHRVGYAAVRGLVCSTCNALLRSVDLGQQPPDHLRASVERYLSHPWVDANSVTPTKTPPRYFRVPDRRWSQAAIDTARIGTDRSAWINDALAWLNREPGAKAPKRPPVSDAPPS